MNTGDLVAFRGRGLLAWIVRTWTRSAYSHVGVLWVRAGLPLVIEALPGEGVGVHALANRQADKPIVFAVARAVDVDKALAHTGDPYSFRDALEAGLNERASSPGWECAEFAAWMYGLNPEAKGWTPKRLVEVVCGS